MSGVKGMHSVRLRPRHQDDVRKKIQASQIVTRLTNHTLGKLKKPMDASQVSAAGILLKKVLPDLNRTEHAGSITLEQLVLEARNRAVEK